jgi:hypothetical protein
MQFQTDRQEPPDNTSMTAAEPADTVGFFFLKHGEEALK